MGRTQDTLYFDAAATTRAAPEVCVAVMRCLEGTNEFANPSSGQHELGRQAAYVVERARADVAVELHCSSEDVIFTSGATESINLALRGVALANASFGRHIVTTQIEHKATLTCCDSLADEGFEITDGSGFPSWFDQRCRQA